MCLPVRAKCEDLSLGGAATARIAAMHHARFGRSAEGAPQARLPHAKGKALPCQYRDLGFGWSGCLVVALETGSAAGPSAAGRRAAGNQESMRCIVHSEFAIYQMWYPA